MKTNPSKKSYEDKSQLMAIHFEIVRFVLSKLVYLFIQNLI